MARVRADLGQICESEKKNQKKSRRRRKSSWGRRRRKKNDKASAGEVSRERIDELANVPKSYRNKAHRLVKHLNQLTNLTWDNNGLVSVDSRVIENSDIRELLENACRRGWTPVLVGFKKFSQVLRSSHVPDNLIINPKFWTQREENSRSTRSGDSSDQAFKSPTSSHDVGGSKFDPRAWITWGREEG